MHLIPTAIPDVLILEPKVFGDHRGFFLETWRREVFAQAGIPDFVQDNHSKSSRGVLRGLHYQIQQPQGKLLRVVQGEIFDVAVDLRRSSPTFGKWVGEILNTDNKRALYVPPGFAHGFYVMSDTAEVTYKCTTYYAPQHERSLLWSDPAIGIAWPQGAAPLLSEKDRNGVLLVTAETFA
jgi:dTDP-4-dehydrorhamnose 3,5-epimerase